jgi:hypothetical protein
MQQFLRDNELGIDFIECARSLVGTHLEIAMQHALVEPIQERCASTNELFLQSILMGEFTIVCVCVSLSASECDNVWCMFQFATAISYY